MTTRTSSKTVTFAAPFSLEGIEGMLPAGSYAVDTDEETIEGLSFVAWRRTATTIRVPVAGGLETHSIDPMDLEASLFHDAEAVSSAAE